MKTEKKHVLVLDQKGNASRCIIFDQDCKIVYKTENAVSSINLGNGHCEQSPEEIFTTQYNAMIKAIIEADIAPQDIAGIGIANQRETVVLWDKVTGNPVHNAITWHCMRTKEICDEILQDHEMSDYIQQSTGSFVKPHFSATKIKWILDHVPGVRKRMQDGEILFGTMDTWLLWKLTGGKVYATDYTNASKTMLFNIHKLCWDNSLFEYLDIPTTQLPEVKQSNDFFGTINIRGVEIPIYSVIGNQQAILVGGGCFEKGDTKNTYDEDSYIMMNIGDNPITSNEDFFTTIAFALDGKVTYAVEGIVYVSGDVIRWLKEGACLINDIKDCEYFANKVADSGGVYYVPQRVEAENKPPCQGGLVGMNLHTTQPHIIRAVLESIVYQTQDVLNSLKDDYGVAVSKISADGIYSENEFVIQFQSDISSCPVLTCDAYDTVAHGVLILTGIKAGFWDKLEDAFECAHNGLNYKPNLSAQEIDKKMLGWSNAVKQVRILS